MKLENGKKEREGEEKAEGRELISLARLLRVCPPRLREEEGR